MKKLVKVLGLGLALSLGGTAMANDYHHQSGMKVERGERMMQRMIAHLELTEAQQQSVHSIRDEAHAAMDAYKAQVGMSRNEMKAQMKAQMQAIVQAENFDEQAFRDLMAQKQAHKEEMALIKAKMKHDIWHVLDAQQQAKMTQMMAKRGERRFGHRGERRRSGQYHDE